jgi:hypothetical protein
VWVDDGGGRPPAYAGALGVTVCHERLVSNVARYNHLRSICFDNRCLALTSSSGTWSREHQAIPILVHHTFSFQQGAGRRKGRVPLRYHGHFVYMDIHENFVFVIILVVCNLLLQLARFVYHQRHVIVFVLARCKPRRTLRFGIIRFKIVLSRLRHCCP